MIKNKKGFEFSFNWMFAIFAGGAVILLAIYGVSQLIESSRGVTQTETGRQFGIILTPAETGIESAKSSAPITFTAETRVYNRCNLAGKFGTQSVQLATKSGFGKEWENSGIPSVFANKYIFSDDIEQGKAFYVFSKAFNFPYKTADLIYMWNESYCFVSAPNEIKKDVEDLKLGNIKVKDSIAECDSRDKIACFLIRDNKCDIIINQAGKSVEKEGVKVRYEDTFDSSLIYGAVFSSPEIYECQVRRLMMRTSELAKLYAEKNSLVGCSSSLQELLETYSNETLAVQNSGGLNNLALKAEELKEVNDDISACKLF